MTAREICALAFDEAGITFAADAKGGNKSFYKNQAKNGGFDGSQKNGGGDKPDKGDEPFDLQKHDQQHHGGHYDGGKCKYREDAVKNGLITPEQAAQKTGQPGQGGEGDPQNPQEQQQQKEEPPQITPEQLLEQFKQHPESISGAKEGIKSEQPQQTETPVGPITTESPVQEAVVKGLSEEAESGNPEAVKALNNLKAFNDLKEEIGAFQRMEGESNDAFIDRFNKLMEEIDPEKFDERQKQALTALAQMQKTRIEQDVGQQTVASRTEGATEPEAPQPTGNPPRVAGRASRRVNPETGLFEYTGADGKTYVDVSGLGAFEAMQAAMKATAAGKEFLDKWDKYSGKWSEIMNAHQTDSTADQNRRASVNAVAGASAEMDSMHLMKQFAEQEGLSPMDRQDAMNRIAQFEAAAGDVAKQAKIFTAFNKWSRGVEVHGNGGTENQSENQNDPTLLDDEGQRVFQSFSKLPTTEELGIKEGEVQMDPNAEAYQRDLEALDQQRNEGTLDAKGYDQSVRQLKARYVEMGYNPDPPKGGKNGWSHNVPANSLFHEISNDEARAALTNDVGEDLNQTMKDLGIEGQVEGTPQTDSNETTYFVRLSGSTQPKFVKSQLEAIKNMMGENGIRLDTVVNGKPGYVAMHIPNRMQDVIGFNKFFEDPETKKALENGLVPIPIGKGPNGKMMIIDLASSATPHALIGGATKSGKSVQGHNIIAGLLMKDSKMCSPMIIDPKGNEFTAYQGIKGVGYSSNPASAVKALLAQQNERRKLLKATGCRNIQEYNAKYPDHPMPYMPVVFDEMTQAFQNAGGPESELAKDVGTLARLARDTGISVIGLTQNADAKSIPTELKNQLGFRMAFRTQTEAASRDLLGLTASQNGNAAKGLKGAGDGYIKNADDSLARFQAAFIPQNDIEALVKWRKARDEGKLDGTKRTPEDIAKEEKDAQFQKSQQEQQAKAGQPQSNYRTAEEWQQALSKIPKVRISDDPSNKMTRVNARSASDMFKDNSIKEGDKFVSEDGQVLEYLGQYQQSNGQRAFKFRDESGREKGGILMEFPNMYNMEDVGKYLETPQTPQPKNYTVDPSKTGNDPGSALQMTASGIISDAKNLSRQEALGHLDQAYQQYLNSMPEGEGRDKLAAAYNTIKNEMMANEAGHPYKPDAPAPAQPQGGEGGTTSGREPPQVQPENLVSPEEAQQLAQKAADKKKFEENHAKYHPTDRKGEEALENEMYNDEANELYKQKEEGKISASKFRKRLSELDEGHKQKLADIADKYGSQGGGEQPKPDNGGQQQQKPQDGQKPAEAGEEAKADGVDKGDDSDPLSMFTNESDDQRKQRAKDTYRETANKIREDYQKHKITFEEAQKLSKEAQAARDKLIAGGKSDEQKAKEDEEAEAKLRETVRTDDGHGKTVAHAIPGSGRGAKGATTPLSFADHQTLTKSLPKDFVLEGGDNPMRDGFGKIWAHHRGGGDKGNGSRGFFDKNNQWHYAVNTTHPAYKGENSPEAQAAKQNWLNPKTPMNKAQEAQARKQYMNLAFGHDEAIPGFGLDCIDNAILDYFRHVM